MARRPLLDDDDDDSLAYHEMVFTNDRDVAFTVCFRQPGNIMAVVAPGRARMVSFFLNEGELPAVKIRGDVAIVDGIGKEEMKARM